MKSLTFVLPLLCVAAICCVEPGFAEDNATIAVDWGQVESVSKSTVTIQVCPEPPLRRGNRLHDILFETLRGLAPDYARLQPWFPYPRMTVAELKPPTKSSTYWDFSLLDEMTEDFMRATNGRPIVFGGSPFPKWMITTNDPIKYPDDPDEIDWSYGIDYQFSDRMVKQLAAYEARVASWYVKGGFSDELGHWHKSGHHYRIDYWDPLNEVDFFLTPKQMTQLYDAIALAIRKVDPAIKFVGPSIAMPTVNASHMTYFLNPGNHAPGVPIDMVSYHLYSHPASDETPESMQYTIFEQADSLLAATRYIEATRKTLIPKAGTNITELGSVLRDPISKTLAQPIPRQYWNMSGAFLAYMYGQLVSMGIDVITVSELIDYPGQVAAATLVDWETGHPNARYWVLKLLRDNFGPGFKLVKTQNDTPFAPSGVSSQYYAQGFIAPTGERKVLLVNKRNRELKVTLENALSEQRVDDSTQAPASDRPLKGEPLTLPPFAVSVVTVQTAASTQPDR